MMTTPAAVPRRAQRSRRACTPARGRAPAWRTAWVVTAWLALSGGTAKAQETTPYPNGTSGIKAGTVPPPGHYWLFYNRIYTADELRDANSEITEAPGGGPLGFDLTGYANVHRFLHVTDYEILGANFSWNFVVPLVNIDMDIAGYGVHDNECRIADMNVEPCALEWHEPRWDFGFVYGFFAPTADRSAARPALPGKKFWTHYIGPAGTYYFDEERLWALSFLSRYEMPTKRQDGVDIHPGQNFSFEWGFSRNMQQTYEIGVSGYCSWQTTLDEGSDVTYVNVHDRAFAAGPEVQYFSPTLKVGYHLRSWWEFGVRDRTQGEIITLTIEKPF
jgi:hypothetical protein